LKIPRGYIYEEIIKFFAFILEVPDLRQGIMVLVIMDVLQLCSRADCHRAWSKAEGTRGRDVVESLLGSLTIIAFVQT
jgi:hypothetical protein